MGRTELITMENKYLLYPFNEKYSSYFLRYINPDHFSVVGCITKDLSYYHSNIPDIESFWIKDAQLGMDNQYIDSILVIIEDIDNYERLTELCLRNNIKLTFISQPSDVVISDCSKKGIDYSILTYKSIDKTALNINIHQIPNNCDSKNVIEIGLRLFNTFKNMGYDVYIQSKCAFFNVFNIDTCNPDIIINLDEYSEESADEFTILISDKFISDDMSFWDQHLLRKNTLFISLHGDSKTRIKADNFFVLNLLGSSIELIVDYLKENFIYPALNFEVYIAKCRKDYFEKYHNSVYFYSILDKHYLLLAELRESIPLDNTTNEILKMIYKSKKISDKSIQKIIANKAAIKAIENFNILFRESYKKGKEIQLRLSLQPQIVNSTEYTISFIGSGKCNLKCKYCYSDHNHIVFNNSKLGTEVMKNGLNFILRQTPKRQDLIKVDFLIGSEPILELDSYKKMIEICREYEKMWGVNINLGILTNGTLLTDEIIDFFDQESQWMGFSLDGGEVINDSVRVYKNNKGSYKNALKCIKKVLSLNWKYTPGASAVVTSQNTDVLRIFMDLWEIGFRYIIIRPVRVSKDNELALTDVHLPEVKSGYAQLAKYLLNKLKEGRLEYLKAILIESDYFGRFLIYTFCNSRIIVKHCTAGESFFSVRNDGSIFPCDSLNVMDLSKQGNLEEGISDKKLNMFVTDMNTCSECWARFMCGGVCNHIKALDADGSLIKANCDLVKYLIELAIHFYWEAKEIISEEQYNLITDHIRKCNRFFEKGTDNFSYGPR